MKYILTSMLLLGLAAVGMARIIYIPTDYETIQEGINASENGDTVLVLPGEYREFISYEGKRILLTSEQGYQVTSIKQAIFTGGTDTTAVLRGFSFSGIKYGGASVKVEAGNSGVIEVNYISGNSVIEQGGGIYSIGDNVIIRNNIISDNRALILGGGISIGGSGYRIEENIISNNIAGGDDESWGGGGIFAQGINFVIEYNLILGNQSGYFWPAVSGGGAWVNIYHDSEIITIRNNTFVENRCLYYSENRGGGLQINLYNYDDSCYVINNIFAYNDQGGLCRGGSSHSFILDYNLFWQNEYGDYQGIEPGPNCLFEDPQFVDPVNGDYYLQEGSPCIDAGDPNSPLDPDSTRADIGCYYYHHSTDILETDEPSGPHKFYLQQNYPNPFNGQTIISYYLPEPAQVQLNIINMRGELVAQPVNSRQPAGDYQLIWQGIRSDGTPVSTGIYFYELKVSGASPPTYPKSTREVKAMILLK